MHIKQITISGFKSYRAPSVAGPFTPGANVVVGRNGSGKSNFFAAVRFILSDAAASLRAEERVALLHEGAGTSVLSAYVEITFDNADGRLPGLDGEPEVVLRRMIGLKKDEYVLNRKNVSRAEVLSLLEAAGFSRSNPYYIVQQGKVAALVAMTDAARLALLMDVAGTSVYDTRRSESLKLLADTDAKRAKVADVLSFISDRLDELGAEKAELARFRTLDRERRALSYALHVADAEAAKAALDAIDDQAADTATGDDAHARLADVQRQAADAERLRDGAEADVSRAAAAAAAAATARGDAARRVATLTAAVRDSAAAAAANADARSRAAASAAAVEAEVAATEARLAPLRASLAAATAEATTAADAAAAARARRLELQVRAGRSEQYATAKDRDAALRAEMAAAAAPLAEAVASATAAEAEAASLAQRAEAGSASLATLRATATAQKEAVAESRAEVARRRAARDMVHVRRDALYHREQELERAAAAAAADVKRAEAARRAVIGGATADALAAVAEAVAGGGALGSRLAGRVYGPLMDLVAVDAKFATAADVTAGGALCHVVVDDDETAAVLVGALQRARAGRVTFIPLNRVGGGQGGGPLRHPPTGADTVALVDKIRSEPRLRPAVEAVWGRTLVARNMAVAAAASRAHAVDCVTLDGDMVNRRGAMSGGFVDARRSRLDAAASLRRAVAAASAAESALATEVRGPLRGVEAELATAISDLQRAEAALRTATTVAAATAADVARTAHYADGDAAAATAAAARAAALRSAVRDGERSRDALAAELGTPLVSGLAPAEAAELERAKSAAPDLEAAASAARRRVEELTATATAAETDLRDNLRVRAAELRAAAERAEATPAARRRRQRSRSRPRSRSRRGAHAGAAADEEEEDEEEAPRAAAEGKSDDDGDASDGSGGSLASAGADPEDGVAAQRAALVAATAAAERETARATAADAALSAAEATRADAAATAERLRAEEAALAAAAAAAAARVDSLYARRAAAAARVADAARRIRELGALPADHDKHRRTPPAALRAALRRVNGGLAAFRGVNKKALDQYVAFAEQRDALLPRRKELDEGAAAIRSLVASLDERKDADILRTFKGVAKHFSAVFAELVPGGTASLIMLKAPAGAKVGASGRAATTGDEEEQEEASPAAGDAASTPNDNGRSQPAGDGLRYTGVGIKVSFAATGAALSLPQLSGGQKSMVALALIFAIQRLDPAPFYLFDEIDAALDAAARSAVAGLIARQAAAGGTQFIVTTFRPELVAAGDRWFGVRLRGRASMIEAVDQAAALSFVIADPT
ncbi:hypothetical protein MMPV_000037 [Pyropia vietnamensis]